MRFRFKTASRRFPLVFCFFTELDNIQFSGHLNRTVYCSWLSVSGTHFIFGHNAGNFGHF